MDLKHNMDISSVSYYDDNADMFVSDTVNADMTHIYNAFEKYLFTGCKIMDLGCGSGRDSKHFMDKGYIVIPVDPSAAMCAKTQKLTGLTPYMIKAEDIYFTNEFDAVWACASLLHVSRNNMGTVLINIANSLKKNGILYSSWKYGNGDRIIGNRLFTDFDETSLVKLINSIDDLEIVDIWKTRDIRKDNKQEWVNAIIRKV